MRSVQLAESLNQDCWEELLEDWGDLVLLDEMTNQDLIDLMELCEQELERRKSE